MKAVILVGGEGTRLRPLTCNLPKAMVPVLNIPFLECVLRYLCKHQIKDIILAQGFLSQPINKYFGDGSQCDSKNVVSCGSPAYSLRRSFASEGSRPAPRDPAANPSFDG